MQRPNTARVRGYRQKSFKNRGRNSPYLPATYLAIMYTHESNMKDPFRPRSR